MGPWKSWSSSRRDKKGRAINGDEIFCKKLLRLVIAIGFKF
jgi:hypothetical protein